MQQATTQAHNQNNTRGESTVRDRYTDRETARESETDGDRRGVPGYASPSRPGLCTRHCAGAPPCTSRDGPVHQPDQ